MVILSDVEELPVGPELNDIGHVQEAEGETRLPSPVFHLTISTKSTTDEPR